MPTIHEVICAEPALVLKGYKHKRKSLKRCLTDLLTKHVFNYDTYLANNVDAYFPYCNADKHRSLGEIYQIIKPFYTKLTPRKVKKTLIQLEAEGVISIMPCGTIGKYTYFKKGDRYRFKMSMSEEERRLPQYSDICRDEYGLHIEDLDFDQPYNQNKRLCK